MSFSGSVKEEIVKHISSARHCRIAELLALIMVAGELHIEEGHTKLLLKPENELIAERIETLVEMVADKKISFSGKAVLLVEKDDLQEIFDIIKLSSSIDRVSSDWIDPEEMEDLPEELVSSFVSNRGVSLEHMHFSRQVLRQECCKRAFLKGLFLAAGSINDPKKNYHLEIVLRSESLAKTVLEILKSFELDAKVVPRKKYFVVYLKEGEQILDVLGLMGAHVSLMDMENVRILKDMRNDINRRVNCETANIRKTVDAAVKQVSDIEYIEKTVGLDYLKPQLRQMAELRISEPEASLNELAQMLDPPVSRSCVNHRLRKISEIADELR